MNILDILSVTKEDKIRGIWLDGIEGEGEYKEWHFDGVTLKVHCFYESGELHGGYKYYYSNGQLCIHCFYENGVKVKNSLIKTV